MKTVADRLDATRRIPDAERRRLIAALNADDGEGSTDDTQRGQTVGHRFEPDARFGKHENDFLAAATAAAAATEAATRKWSRSYVRNLRQKDFVPCSNCRPALVGWIAFIASVMRMFIPRRRHTIGSSVGIIVEQPILDLVGITPETELNLTTDGTSLVITPHVLSEAGRPRTAKVEARMLKTVAGGSRGLGW